MSTLAPTTRATRTLATWSAVFAGLGLASGLYYREFSKHYNWDARSQLNVAHTHWLMLGAVLGLVFTLVEDRFRISERGKQFTAFLITWIAGVVITSGMLVFKGSAQIMEKSWADSPALAGISGLGHMTLTAMFILFFLGLLAQIKKAQATPAAQEPTVSV
ncbi:DUF2871 family protein [Aestuariimicrobium ganziense]|uniref:DUF2871 family protein n=1 Tax=Aestuariimicrobium ganziense TaxID=2773677 RepID=UPI001944D4A7|nr:DUF2871 family protein [Aestuariimicrobium ganziense]